MPRPRGRPAAGSVFPIGLAGAVGYGRRAQVGLLPGAQPEFEFIILLSAKFILYVC